MCVGDNVEYEGAGNDPHTRDTEDSPTGMQKRGTGHFLRQGL